MCIRDRTNAALAERLRRADAALETALTDAFEAGTARDEGQRLVTALRAESDRLRTRHEADAERLEALETRARDLATSLASAESRARDAEMQVAAAEASGDAALAELDRGADGRVAQRAEERGARAERDACRRAREREYRSEREPTARRGSRHEVRRGFTRGEGLVRQRERDGQRDGDEHGDARQRPALDARGRHGASHAVQPRPRDGREGCVASAASDPVRGDDGPALRLGAGPGAAGRRRGRR